MDNILDLFETVEITSKNAISEEAGQKHLLLAKNHGKQDIRI